MPVKKKVFVIYLFGIFGETEFDIGYQVPTYRAFCPALSVLHPTNGWSFRSDGRTKTKNNLKPLHMSHTCIYVSLKEKYATYFSYFLKGTPLSDLERDFGIEFREFYCVFSNLLPCSDIYGLIYQVFENQFFNPSSLPLQSIDELSRLAENLSKVPFKIMACDHKQLTDIFIDLSQLGIEIKNLDIRNRRVQYI